MSSLSHYVVMWSCNRLLISRVGAALCTEIKCADMRPTEVKVINSVKAVQLGISIFSHLWGGGGGHAKWIQHSK